MQLLLTGASGFLGTILRNALTIDEFNINSLGRGKASDLNIDIRYPFTLEVNRHPEIVVHAAGKAHSIPKTEDEKREFYKVNYEGPKNLCRALEGLHTLPRTFVFISSVAVYGIDQGENINENHPLNGVTPYAESKILAEEWLRSWAANNNVTLNILRLPLIAGPNPPGNLGAMIEGVKTGKYLSIGRANAKKSIVWGYDIASIIPHLAQKGGIYNLTDGYHPSFRELEETIASALNKRKPTRVPYWVAKGLAKTGDILGHRFPINSEKLKKITSSLTFDDAKAKNELGWAPTPVLSKVAELVKTLRSF